MIPPPPLSTLFPYTTLFRSQAGELVRLPNDDLEVPAQLGFVQHPLGVEPLQDQLRKAAQTGDGGAQLVRGRDRKSTRLNSSHLGISYAVFCLKKKKKQKET